MNNKKYLYKNFKQDKRIYNLNQGYWKRKFKFLIKEKFSQDNILFKNIDDRGNKVYDANPIFSFINYNKTKAIRIIQDDATSINFNSIEIENYLISAWIDNIVLYDNNFSNNKRVVNELVIALFLTKETVDKAIKLIAKWLREDLNNDEINKIINIT